MSGLSVETRAMLRAARESRPSAGSREAMWQAIEAAGVAPAGLAAAKGLSTKLALGTLLGGVVTVGLVAALHSLRPRPQDGPAAAGSIARGRSAIALPRAAVTMDAPAPAPSTATAADTAGSTRPAVADQGDALGREARLVSEARGALLRGDAERSLALLGVVRALPVKQLEPEELTLEARALRSLGRMREAREVEGDLVQKYPEQVLP